MYSSHSLRSPWRRSVVVFAAGSLVAALAGCGSDDEGTTGGNADLSAKAQQCVDKANDFLEERGGLLPESLPSELTPLSKPPEKGLTITRLFDRASPTSAEYSNQIVKAAPVAGWTGKAVAFDSSVEDVNRKALAAIDDSDIVYIDGYPPAAMQAPIKAAKEKGVLLMLGAIKEPPESVPGFGGSPLGGDSGKNQGELSAYMMMKATNCQAKAAAFGLPAPLIVDQVAKMKEVLAKECPDCSLSYTDIPFSDIGSPAATNAVVSKLQTDPSINFAFFGIGDLAFGLEPALKQAGLDPKIGGVIPTPTNLSALKKGDNTFWIGVPQRMSALLALDTAMRALESGKPTTGDHYPYPVFTPDNIESTDPIPMYPEDAEEQFQKLWKIS